MKYKITKKNISLFSQIATIALIFMLYVVADYLKFGGTLEFISDAIYWITTSIGLVLVITLMIVIRAMRKDKQIEDNTNIQDNLITVDCVRRVVLSNAYSEILQKHIDEENLINKYETYINKYTKKINRLQTWGFFLPLKKREKKLKKLEAILNTPKEEVLKKNFKYKKITQTSLFSGVDGKIAITNRFDTSTHESKDVAQMVTYKALITYILTAFTGTLIVDFIWNGFSALWSTFIKLFAMTIAVNSAIKQADNFVNYNITQALDNRLRILTNFVNSNEEVKEKVILKKQELLRERN